MEGTIEARPDLVHWTLSYEEASAEAKRTAALKEALKNHIDFLMGNIEVALLPDGRKWVRKEISSIYQDTQMTTPTDKGKPMTKRSAAVKAAKREPITLDATPAATTPALPAVVAPASIVPMDADKLFASAISSKASVDTLERLMVVRRELRAEESQRRFVSAMSAFQQECPIIKKKKKVSITPKDRDGQRGTPYSYNYAPLDQIVKEIAPLLAKHGFSYTLETNMHVGDGMTAVEAICTAHHVDGHSASSAMRVPVDTKARMNPSQQVASAQTFAKRYAFQNAFGILTGDTDDDGRGAFQHERDAQPIAKPTVPGPSAKKPGAAAIPATALKPSQVNIIRAKLKSAGRTEIDLTAAFPGKSLEPVGGKEQFTLADFNLIQDWITGNPAN